MTKPMRQINLYHIGGDDPPPAGDKTKKLLDDVSAFVRDNKFYLLAGAVAYLYLKNAGDTVNE